jgi:thiol:disulfide interchange protein
MIPIKPPCRTAATKPLARRWHQLALILCLGLSLPGAADADDFSPQASGTLNLAQPATSGSNNFLAPQDEFLPVDQAYQLDYRLEQQTLLLHWKIAEGYYLYEERFKFTLADGTQLSPSYTQGKMKYDELFERETMLHHHEVTVSLPLAAADQTLLVKVESQGCAEKGLCYPPQKLQLKVDISAQSVAPFSPATGAAQHNEKVADNTAVTPATKAPADAMWLLQAIIFAMLGGAILNLMPCVFPVLSIKIMSLAAADRSRLVIHGWVYTLGIVVCFVGFALALIVARTGGEAIGWGFQLQSPGLIAALSYLFFIMGLSMSGLIHFGGSLMGAGQKLTQKSGLSGSFFTGVLAAVVASPCTAPFMGAALGFALTQPTYVALAVFAALGFGMALPLLLLCYLPLLADRLPKPGAWMDNLKHFLAFPLYLSAVWLLWVFGRQTNVSSMAALCVGAVAIAFGCWLLGRHTTGISHALRQLTIAASLFVAIALPWQQLNSSRAATESNRWQAYSPELLAQLRSEGRPVFINLTADWCLTCLANERISLHAKTVEAAFDAQNVASIKGDWTNTAPQITALLSEYGRSGVPLYLWFPAQRAGKADVLPQLLSKDMLIEMASGENN